MRKAIVIALLAASTAYLTYAQSLGAAPRRAMIVPPCVPAVTSVTPNRGPNTGGTSVTLNGTCFTGATRVSFDGRLARSFQVLSATQVTAVSPTWYASRFPVTVLMFVCKPLQLYIQHAPPQAVRCSPRNLQINFTFFKNGTANVSAPRSALRNAPSPQTIARIKAMRRQGALHVRAAFLARKANLQAQWLANRIARARRLVATHRSAPAALRSILNRNVSSLVALRQTVVKANRPLTGSFSADVSRALFHGGIGTFHGVPHVLTPPPTPTITALSSNYGQPGDEIIITGSGFDATAAVTFLLSANAVGPGGTGSVQQATSVFWINDEQVVAYVPNVSGITAYSGSLYVQTASGKSNVVAFQFQPAFDVQQLPIGSGNVQWGGTECGAPNGKNILFSPDGGRSVFVSYCSDAFTGSKGDDWFFKSNRLANGWMLDSPNFDTSECPVTGGDGASVVSSGQGTNTPYVDVHWWDTPNWGSSSLAGVACYSLSLTITGPLGTPW